MDDDLARMKKQLEPQETKVLKLDRQLNAVRFTPCGRFLLAAGHDGLIRRFDLANADIPELKPLTGHHGWVQRLAVSADPNATNEPVYSVDSWGQLRCGSYADAELSPRWSHPAAHDGWILDLALSPSGKLVATCGIDRKVRIWSAGDGAKLHEFDNPDWEVLCVLFAPDEGSILSGDLAGIVRQWDLATGKVTRELKATDLHKSDRLQEVGGVRRMLFTPDGKSLLCAGTKPKGGGNVQGIPAIVIFDWESGPASKTLELGKEGDVYITEMLFYPAGFLMATISGNPGVGKLLFQRLEDTAPFFETTKMPNCHSVAVHPNHEQLAVVATNGGSNGNGRNVDKDGKYPGNFSPIHLWKMPLTQTAGS